MKTKHNSIRRISILPSAIAMLALLAQPASAQTGPTITRQPASQTNVAGTSVTFSVGVSGTGPFTYQWRLNGTNLPNYFITSVAGNGTNGYSGDGGAATNASLSRPSGFAMDAAGNLYISDANDNIVRRVDGNGIITTFTGNGTNGYSGDGGAATNSSLSRPVGLTMDSFGNLLIADSNNNRIRKVATNGIITTVAGTGMDGFSGDAGASSNAKLSNPQGVAVDGFGNLFIADAGNERIRKVDSDGIIITVAGNPPTDQYGYTYGGYSGDGGAATRAELNNPSGVAVDALGNLFIVDSNNNAVRKVDANGFISTVAGNFYIDPYLAIGYVGGYAGDGGAATNAILNRPTGLASDGSKPFIADSDNNVIRKVDANGIISTVAGRESSGYSGDGAAATSASLLYPTAVAADAVGNLFIADAGNYRVRKVDLYGSPALTLDDPTGADIGEYQVTVTNPYGSVTSTVASLTVLIPAAIISQPANFSVKAGGAAVFNMEATGTPPPAYAWYFNTTNLVQAGTNSTLSLGNVNLTNSGNYAVVVTNLFGRATSAVAHLSFAYAPTIIQQPVSQTGGSTVLSVAVSSTFTGPFRYQWQFNGTNLPNDFITTVAGGGNPGRDSVGDGGAATNASLALEQIWPPTVQPIGVAADASGNLFIADSGHNRIRKVDANGIISTVAGGLFSRTVDYFGDGGAATNTILYSPSGVAVDVSGNLFISDSWNNLIWKVTTNGMMTTVAGNYLNGGNYFGDGGAATNAGLWLPVGVAVDASGNLYIADQANQAVRKVDTNGIITTVAGGNGMFVGSGFSSSYSGDGGPATNAGLSNPSSVAVDAVGNIFIADAGNGVIRKVDLNGIVTTVAGSVCYTTNQSGGITFGSYSGDGGPAINACLALPSSVAVDASGNLFIADESNQRIRKVDASGIITTVAGNGNLAIDLAGAVSGTYSGDGGPATNASLNLLAWGGYCEQADCSIIAWGGVAVDAVGNLFITDVGNGRVRKVNLAGIPSLTLGDLSTANAGDYRVIITSPYGSVTSAVATVTVLLPAVIVMNAPIISANNLLLGFSISNSASTSFTLLETPNLAGPWTTNTAAVLTTNAQTGGFQFSIPAPNSVEFYRVRSL